MSALQINPFEYFTDTNGDPLDAGYIYVGVANLDPETNPIDVFYDSALTIPVSQPIRTVNGYVLNAGAPAALYVGSDYSVRVRNKNLVQVYAIASLAAIGVSVAVEGVLSTLSGDGGSALVGFKQEGTGAVLRTAQDKLRETVSILDFGAVANAMIDPNNGLFQENPDAYDNTGAIQAALNYTALYRKNLYVPSGFYGVSGELFPQNMGLGPRRGQRIKGEACETSVIIALNRQNIFNIDATTEGSITFETIGIWGRYRDFPPDSITPYTTDDVNTAIYRPTAIKKNMRLRLNEVQFRFFETAVDGSGGSWLTQIEKCEFIGVRYAIKLKDSYAVYIKGNNFICGTAIHSPTSALLQCEIADNHFDIGTFRTVTDRIAGTMTPYSTIDIATQGVDFNNNYFEIYGTVDPAHIVLDIHSQISDRSSFKETYINVGAKECILRRMNSTVASSFAQSLSFDKTTLIASNPTTKKSWWTFDPSLVHFFYKYDDIQKDIDDNNNPLIPLNQEHLRLYGTLIFDPNIAVQKFDFNAMTFPVNNSYIGNTKMITAAGKLNLKGGEYEIIITPQSLQPSTVSKSIDIEINGSSGNRAKLFDGVRSSGLSAQLRTYITSSSLAGTDRQIDLICTGFSGAATISLLCTIEIRMISSQRLLF